jgi:hypothetical protein
MAINLDTQATTTQQRLTCALKNTGCCLMVASASAIREMRSSSVTTSHRNLQRKLDWTGRANGLASQVTGAHTNGLLPMGATLNP